MENWGEVIPVSSEQADNFVCNGIEIARDLAVLPWIDYTTKLRLRHSGYEAVSSSVSQFLLSGGGPKCLVLELWPDAI